MAEINNEGVSNKHKKSAFKKKNTRVDLTPMVDLGFLLITFFVFTTTLSLPTVMNVNMPFDKVRPGDEVCESCVLTVLLAKDNMIKYYEGNPVSNPVIKETFFGNNGIRNIILQKRKAVQKLKGSSDDFVMIIQPTDESTFQNFVDIVDEVAINTIKHYYITEIE
jgi:biopolymer transport protein ExbD